MSRLIDHLIQLDHQWPVERKMLIGPDLGWGRELLCTLARDAGGWVGWEAVTPKLLAGELAFTTMAERDLRSGNDLEIAAVSEAALEAAVRSGGLQGRLARLAGRPGIRVAVHDALQSLRASGLSLAEVQQRAPAGSAAQDLGRILGEYLRLLNDRKLLDPADLFRLALEALDAEAPFVLAPHLVVAGELSLRGIRGKFVRTLLERSAVVLRSDAAHVTARALTAASLGAPAPPVEVDAGPAPSLFSATTPSIELREVLRRALAAELAWGDIEIAATDEDRYGIELEAVSSHLGIPCTFRNGLPLERSRTGRAVARFLAFLSEGLPANALRAALESGELASPDPGISPARLARQLRKLKIGWGRERLSHARDALAGQVMERIRQRDDEPAEAYAVRLEQEKLETETLGALLTQVLELLPPVPERGDYTEVETTPGALARAVRSYLGMLAQPELSDAEVAGDHHLRERLVARLDEVERLGGKSGTFAGALTELEAVLAELRAWPELRGGAAGASAGDAIHFTHLTHAGLTGRRATFVVGLDADRVGGARVQDALLPDAVRHALDPDALPTLATRQAENAWKLELAQARLTGDITLSYAVRGSETGSSTGPSHYLLDAFRRAKANDTLTYDKLRAHLGEPRSAVPAGGAALLDDRDAWLAAVSDGALLLDGAAQVRDGFPDLERGLALRAELASSAFRSVHGLVANPEGLDPSDSSVPVSASQLETLARCPLAWFYRYGIGIRAPEDPEYDPDAWLSPAERGSLLHEVYAAIGQAYQGRRGELDSDAARARAEAIAQERIDTWRNAVPPPSESVFLAEAEELRRAAMEFRSCEIEDYQTTGADPFMFEQGVDYPDSLPFAVGARILRVFGRIDRVDRLPDGTLRVVDFKTGSPARYSARNNGGAFNGGRHLQAGIYAAMAEKQVGKAVQRFEYRFPTHKGANFVAGFPRAVLDETAGIIDGLLHHVRAGEFVPTATADDCKYCDAAPICRVQVGNFYQIKSAPRAEWAAEHADTLDVFTGMRQRRGEQ